MYFWPYQVVEGYKCESVQLRGCRADAAHTTYLIHLQITTQGQEAMSLLPSSSHFDFLCLLNFYLILFIFVIDLFQSKTLPMYGKHWNSKNLQRKNNFFLTSLLSTLALFSSFLLPSPVGVSNVNNQMIGKQTLALYCFVWFGFT